MRREQNQQTILLQNKVENQITYLSRILNGNAEGLLTPIRNKEKIKETLKRQGVNNPSEQDITEEQLASLKGIYEKELETAIENYGKVALSDNSYVKFKKVLLPLLKEKGIPNPIEIKDADSYKEFGKLLTCARKKSALNKENNTLSTTEVMLGIFMIAKSKSLPDIARWERGKKLPHNAKLVRAACAFLNVDQHTSDRLVKLGGKTIEKTFLRSRYFAGEDKEKNNALVIPISRLKNSLKKKIEYLHNLKNDSVEKGLRGMESQKIIDRIFSEKGITAPTEKDLINLKIEFADEIYAGLISDGMMKTFEKNKLDSQRKNDLIKASSNLIKKGVPEKTISIKNYLSHKDFGELFISTRNAAGYSRLQITLGASAVTETRMIKTETIGSWENGRSSPDTEKVVRGACRFMNIEKRVENHLVKLAEKRIKAERGWKAFHSKNQFNEISRST